jgi:predicted dehydrogenase
MTLRAMVLGAGSAGEGHALALRQAGAEVVAIASRTAEVVRRVADDLGIPVATTEWRTALADLRPDIVAIATPGDSHVEMIEAALAQHCHIYVDKPVAVMAGQWRRVAAMPAEQRPCDWRRYSVPDAGSMNTALRDRAYPHVSSGRLTTIGVAVLRTTTQ